MYQGGGNEVAERPLPVALRRAIDDALVRLFPRFAEGDHASWDTVITRATQGNADALAAVGYSGTAEKHPVSRELLAFIGNTGKRGSEIRKRFTGAGYGWPQDAVDGALLALVAADFVRASFNGQPQAIKQITRSQIGNTEFFRQGVTISAAQRIAVRGLLSSLGRPVKQGEEAQAIPIALQSLRDLATAAGGDAPRPAVPSTALVDDLRFLGGNEQFAAVYERRDELLAAHNTWSVAQQRIAERSPHWDVLLRLWQQARGLPVADEIGPQIEAIRAGRTLLDDPDPVPPLHDRLAGELRSALQAAYQKLRDARQHALDALEASDAWNSLSEGDRHKLLGQHGLGPLPELDVGDDRALLEALDRFPLVETDHQTALVPAKLATIREQAAKILEPKAVVVSLPHATLRTADEVNIYLARLRDAIMPHVEANKPVII